MVSVCGQERTGINNGGAIKDGGGQRTWRRAVKAFESDRHPRATDLSATLCGKDNTRYIYRSCAVTLPKFFCL